MKKKMQSRSAKGRFQIQEEEPIMLTKSTDPAVRPSTPLAYAQSACDTMIRRYAAADLPPKGHFHYHQGVFLSGVYKTYQLCGNEAYFSYMKDWIDSVFTEDGRIKNAGDDRFFQYAQESGAKVAVYRFVNLMGHSRPKYNSAVSTFCWAVANAEPFTVNDRSTELELLYIDDLVEGMFDLLEGKEQHCEFDGVETVLQADGRYCCVPVTHKVTLGEIVDLLQEFKAQPSTLMMPKMPDGSFAKKLYSL